MNIRQYIEKAVSEKQQKTFLYFEDKEITYEELNTAVNRRANYFLDSGVRKGDIVALLLQNCPEFLYNWFALVKIGGIMVPINTAYKQEEVKYVLNHSGAKAVISSSKYLDIIQEIKHEISNLKEIISIEDSGESETKVLGELIKRSPSELKEIEITEDDTACILYTSGTTGPPKGCILPNDYYTITGENHIKFAGITSNDRLITHLPLFHMNAQCIATISAIIAGASLILIDRFSASRFWDQISKYRPTIFNYIGSILSILEKLPESRAERMHTMPRCYGGGGSKEQIERFEKRFKLKVIEAYGSSEDSTVTSNYFKDGPRRIGSVGVPSPGREVKIVDGDGNELPPNVKGEIVVRGKPMMKGYFKNTEDTAEAMRSGWFYTGDIGFMDEDGFLYFSGREKDIIRRAGENISSVEVENVIKLHPKVLDAGVIGVPDEIRGEEVKVYVILQAGETEANLPPTEIISFCSERLAYFKVPRYVEYRNKDLPRTSTQRIKKYELKAEKEDLTEGCFDKEKAKN